MSSMRFAVVLPFALALGFAACSSSNAPAPEGTNANASAGAATQAGKEQALYQQMLSAQQWELALPIGQEIVAKYPGTAAATTVQATLADTEAKAHAASETRRLARLWWYQSGPESGGTQNTASIYSSHPSGESDRVRLVLRRHSAWGQSVYLFGRGKGFECVKVCTLQVRFDDQVHPMKAYLPETGEPAIFIQDDKGFIARMTKAHKVGVEVAPKGRAKQTYVFEVGGYDPAKFPELARKK